MQYNKNKSGKYLTLSQKNVDTGMGVERTFAALNGLEDNYQTSLFLPIIKKIEKISGKKYKKTERETKAMRIIADHVKASVFILGDEKGIKPSNVERGYILRRLIRRAIRYGKILGIKENFTSKIAESVFPIYPDYPELKKNKKFILKELEEEENRFSKTLEKGLKKFKSLSSDTIITGKEAFLLFQSFGFPIEMTEELANEKGLKIDLEEYNKEFKKHQELSRTATIGKFKSGLADDSKTTKKLHTTTHLLNESLRRVLSKDIKQKGSNINPKRLRFDFNFTRKLTPEEIKKVESLVNKKIKASLPIKKEELPLKQALKQKAQAEFGAKYPEMVFVYTIEDPSEKTGWFSKEICTGPHVENTSKLGKFKIVKEESSAAGIRRIKATLN
jgi:alanyl-tRNA synthetase